MELRQQRNVRWTHYPSRRRKSSPHLGKSWAPPAVLGTPHHQKVTAPFQKSPRSPERLGEGSNALTHNLLCIGWFVLGDPWCVRVIFLAAAGSKSDPRGAFGDGAVGPFFAGGRVHINRTGAAPSMGDRQVHVCKSNNTSVELAFHAASPLRACVNGLINHTIHLKV